MRRLGDDDPELLLGRDERVNFSRRETPDFSCEFFLVSGNSGKADGPCGVIEFRVVDVGFELVP
jgi:hypothetical protein